MEGIDIDIETLLSNGFTTPIPTVYLSSTITNTISIIQGYTQLLSLYDTTLDPTKLNNDDRSDTYMRDICAIWLPILRFLDDSTHTSDACTYTTYECPYIFFFVRYALGQGLCIPKLVLTIYDSMITHLSSSIIKCHNPTCQHNKLDKSNSNNKIIFKKCSRCHAAIYFCRDCQVAHYPIHKIGCRQHGV